MCDMPDCVVNYVDMCALDISTQVDVNYMCLI